MADVPFCRVFFYQTMSDNLRMLNSAALLSLTAVFCCQL